MASLPPCRLYGAAIQRAPPLGPDRDLTWPCGWNNGAGTCGGGFKVPTPNNSLAFYSWFFEGGVANGMVAFEPDFMNVQAKCVPEFTDELGPVLAFEYPPEH